MRPRRRGRILIATAAVAVGAPAGAAALVAHRTQALADHLTSAGGVPARVGSIDADLTGTIRLADVAFGSLVQADTIEASVAMGSLLAGRFGADEIRVTAPRIAVHVDADGDSDLARLARRLGRSVGSRPAAPSDAGTRVRRIIVDGGSLTAHVSGIGEITADNVELVPEPAGVRVITGAVRLRGAAGPVRVALDFQRSAADLALPRARFGRVLAVAGTGAIVTGDRRLALRDVAAGRLVDGGPLELRAAIDDAGARRPVAVQLQLASSTPAAASPATPAARRDVTLTVTGERVPLDAFALLVPPSIGLDGARATGTLVARRAGETAELELDGSLDGAHLDHRRVAPAPILVSGTLRGAIAIAPGSIVVRDARLAIGAATITGHGWLRRGTPVSGQLDLELAVASCPLLLASLPAELRGPLDGMAVGGELGGRMHLGIDLAAPAGDGVELAAELIGRCKVADEPPAADVRSLAGIADQLYPDGTRARVGRGTPGWIELRTVPSHVSGAFVSAEDGRYWDHRGFDLVQIARSLEIDLREHRLARGGSTISQQLVKNAFLTHRRSLDRKVQEAILTWRLEDRLDKKQILERYLNIIELGPHVFGIGAAALHWFGTTPRELSVRQAAFLAALTSEPASMSRRVRHAGNLDPDSAARLDIILRAMRRDGLIETAVFDGARHAPMRFAASALAPER